MSDVEFTGARAEFPLGRVQVADLTIVDLVHAVHYTMDPGTWKDACDHIDSLRAEVTVLRAMLRDVVVDYVTTTDGCDQPATCECSGARAARLLGLVPIEPEPCESPGAYRCPICGTCRPDASVPCLVCS